MKEIKGVKYRILFICLGNICRSPAAEGVMKSLVDKAGLSDNIYIDSAGLNGYHDGEDADPRMMRRAAERGYTLTSISRRIKAEVDFDNFDIVIGMDSKNIEQLMQLAPNDAAKAKIHLMTEYCQKVQAECVPDPYYGTTDGFNLVLDILEDSCSHLLDEIKKNL